MALGVLAALHVEAILTSAPSSLQKMPYTKEPEPTSHHVLAALRTWSAFLAVIMSIQQ